MTDTRWRDSVPADVRTDLDALLDAVLTHIRKRLDDKGGFLPFPVGLADDGELRFPPPKGPRAPKGDPVTALTAAWTHAREDRDDLRAAAVVSDTTLSKTRDAVRVDLEHREGHAVMVLLPYSPSHKPGGRPAAYHSLVLRPGVAGVWSDEAPMPTA